MASFLEGLCKKALHENDKFEVIQEITKHLEEDSSKSEYLWSYNGISILLFQELISSFYILNTEKFTQKECSKICSVLNLLQILVGNPIIKENFLKAQLSFYLYPFLNVTGQTQQYENLRVASLGVIGTLVKNGDEHTVHYLKNTEMVPLTLKIMDIGSEVSKIVASHIFLKIINNDDGLEYACQTFDRYVAIYVILNSMLFQCANSSNHKLIENVLDCYIRMCEKENVRNSFSTRKPDSLSNVQVQKQIKNNPVCQEKYERFCKIITKGSGKVDYK